MTEITRKTAAKITPTNAATPLGIPDPATTITKCNVTTDLVTISRNRTQ